MPHVPTEMAARDLTPARFQQEIIPGCQPVVIRGLVAEWPVVKAAREGCAKSILPMAISSGNIV